MGLESRNSGNTTYLSIYGGSIVREWRKGEPKQEYIPSGKELKSRKISKGPNEGKEVFFVEYDALVGMLEDVELKTGGDYGAQLLLKIRDVDELYSLSMNVDSAPAQSFLLKMNNLDLTEEISLEPWSMTADEWKKLTGKDTKGGKSGMTIRQGSGDDNKIENFYTKDDPKGMPELIIKKVRGETKVDSTDRDIFLDEKLKEFIEKLKGTESKAKPQRATAAAAPGGEEQEDEEYDDLPF